jgi:AraC-like DNA-binding protein
MTAVPLAAELEFQQRNDRHDGKSIAVARLEGGAPGIDDLVGKEIGQRRSAVDRVPTADPTIAVTPVSPGLPMICDTSDGLDPEQAFAAWCRHMAPLFDIRTVDGCGSERFCFGFDVVHCNRFLIGYLHSTAQQWVRTDETIAGNPFDSILINCVVRGRQSGEVEGRKIDVGPGDVCVIDLSRTALLQASAAFTAISILVPRHEFGDQVGYLGRLHGLVLGRGTYGASTLGVQLSHLHHHRSLWKLQQAPEIATTTIALVVGVLGSTAMRQLDPESHRPDRSKFFQIRDFIEHNLHRRDLSSDLIVRRFAISRATLYRLFQPIGGVSVHIRRRRLRHCFEALSRPANGERKIADIALEWGFPDESAFTRSFKLLFGISPRELRVSRTAVAPIPHRGGRSPHSTLDRWIFDLAC